MMCHNPGFGTAHKFCWDVLGATQFKQGQEFMCAPGAYTVLPVVLVL